MVSLFSILLLSLINSIVAADGGAAMSNPAAMMTGGMPMPGQPATDFMKLYQAEKENLEMVEHVWICAGVEERIFLKYGGI